MTESTLSRSVCVRSYRESVLDAGRIYRLSPDTDIRAALKRAAMAAVQTANGWALQVFTVERTAPSEHVVAVLDRLARREMGGTGFAAGLAATLDGATAVLVVAARDARCIERVRSALVGEAR